MSGLAEYSKCPQVALRGPSCPSSSFQQHDMPGQRTCTAAGPSQPWRGPNLTAGLHFDGVRAAATAPAGTFPVATGAQQKQTQPWQQQQQQLLQHSQNTAYTLQVNNTAQDAAAGGTLHSLSAPTLQPYQQGMWVSYYSSLFCCFYIIQFGDQTLYFLSVVEHWPPKGLQGRAWRCLLVSWSYMPLADSTHFITASTTRRGVCKMRALT